jgi:SRSO17 transposase
VADLGDRLRRFWQRDAAGFRTQTRDRSEDADHDHYLSGLLRMPHKRTFTHSGRQTGVAGQNPQHFVSHSPWSAQDVIAQVQAEIAATPGLERGGLLLLDESADRKAGDTSAGAGRQHNGRVGSVQMSQGGTFLAYANAQVGLGSWVDGELVLPEDGLREQKAARRQQVGLPDARVFQTKSARGWKMIQRARVPYEAVACATLDGRSVWLRRPLPGAGILSRAEVPATTQVYLSAPVLGVPPRQPGRGAPPTTLRVWAGQPLEVRPVAQREETLWPRVRVRHTARGVLEDALAARPVGTTYTNEKGQAAVGPPVREWLVLRVRDDGKRAYALSNAPADASLERRAGLKCQRYFVERTTEDAKAELGWDDLAAQTYRAWEHHLALRVLAAWFVAQTKLEWARRAPRDPLLATQVGREVLPALRCPRRMCGSDCGRCCRSRPSRPRTPPRWLSSPWSIAPARAAAGANTGNNSRRRLNLTLASCSHMGSATPGRGLC